MRRRQAVVGEGDSLLTTKKGHKNNSFRVPRRSADYFFVPPGCSPLPSVAKKPFQLLPKYKGKEGKLSRENPGFERKKDCPCNLCFFYDIV